MICRIEALYTHTNKYIYAYTHIRAYIQLAQRVVGLSACVDILIIAEEGYVGVEVLAPLVERVGGTLVYYPGLGTSALPQVWICVYVCMYVYLVYMCVYVYPGLGTSALPQVWICVYVCMYVYLVYVCVYVYPGLGTSALPQVPFILCVCVCIFGICVCVKLGVEV